MIGFLTITGFAMPVGRKGDGPLFVATGEGLPGAFAGALTGTVFAAEGFAAAFVPTILAGDLGTALGGSALGAAFLTGADFTGGFFTVGAFLAALVFTGRAAGLADFDGFAVGRALAEAAGFFTAVFALTGFLTALRDLTAGFARFFTGAFVAAGRFFFAAGCFFFLGEGCFFCAMFIAKL